MTSLEAWEKILNKLLSSPGDFKSVPRTSREPVWFNASTCGGIIYVDSAKEKNPSSRISVPRKIRFEDFENVYEFYNRWTEGEKGIRSEVRKKSRNTAYIFALIKNLVTNLE